MHKTRHKRPLHFDFDLIVIGSGSASAGAHLARREGKKVAIVEADLIGGECPNVGCVPTKALLQAAEVYRTAKDGARFGIRASGLSVSYPSVKAWKDLAVKRTGTSEGAQLFAHEGIKLLRGHAHFLSPWSISVNGRRYTARNFLIATGTRPVVPPIPGLKEAGYLNHRSALDLIRLPKSVFIIGGGAIGCEFAELFNTFGVKVHLAEFAPVLVPLEDPEVGETLADLFERRGVNVQTAAKVIRVDKKGSLKVVSFEQNGAIHQATVEEIFVSAGMRPNTDLGLENAGVNYTKAGITTNTYMQTAAKHIYAAGDVVGPYRFTHMASYQSRIATHNMFHRKRKFFAEYHAVPRCVFVEPEIACVGLTERELKQRRKPFQTASVPIAVLGRANTSDTHEGFVKVLATPKGKLLGASIVSPRAGEMIHELALAVRHGMYARSVAQTIHAYPTWSEAIRLACQKIKSK